MLLAPVTVGAQEDEAESLVRLYYVLQGEQAPAEEKIRAGVPAAEALLAEGYEGTELVNLVIQANKDLPGAKNQPFELLFPPYVHGSGPPGESVPAAAPAVVSGTELSDVSRLDQPVQQTGAKKYLGAVLAATIIDLVGYLTWSIGGIVSIQAPGGYVAMVIGGSIVTVGSLMWTITMSAAEGKLRRDGGKPRAKFAAGAWILTSLTLACAGASWAPVGMIGWIACSSSAVIFEIINMATRPKWAAELAAAEAKLASRSPRVRPFVSVATEPGGRETVALLGIGGEF